MAVFHGSKDLQSQVHVFRGLHFRGLSSQSFRSKDLQSHVQVFRGSVSALSLPESTGPSKLCLSLQPGFVSAVSQRAKDHQSHVQVFRPESVSTVSRRTKDLQSHVSHVQVFRGLSPQSLGQQRTFKVMSKSSGVCLRSISESKGPSKSCQLCPSLQGSVSAVSRRAKDHHTAQLRVCRGFRNVCSVLPLR